MLGSTDIEARTGVQYVTRVPAKSGFDFLTCGDAARHAGVGRLLVDMALVMIMKVLEATCSSRRTMPDVIITHVHRR